MSIYKPIHTIHNVYIQEALSQMQELIWQHEVAHAEDAPEPTATTSTERSRKRKRSGLKRGERGLNRFPDDIYAISEVESASPI